jgi:hypothetical protein
MDPEFSNTGFKECAEYLQSHGYSFDYVSDKQLQGPLPAQYRTILLPACRYLPIATVQKLLSLARQGITILVYKQLPVDAPGLNANSNNFRQLLVNHPFTVGADLPTLLGKTTARRETLVDDSLAVVRRNYGNGKVYFILNKSTKPFAGYLPLNAAFTAAGIFDPMTGEKGLASTKANTVYLQLRPGQSCIVETNVAPRGPVFAWYTPSGAPLAIGTDLHPAPFTDTMKYTLLFKRPASNAGAWLLDLGKVVRNAEVSLNGDRLATLIGPEFRLTIPAEAIQANNRLEIVVRGGMINRIIDLDRKHLPWKKFYNTNFPAHDRTNRGADGLFDASKWTPVDEGLMGPITLTPLTLIHP